MSQVTLPSSWALLLCACAERSRPSCHFLFFRFHWKPEMPPDAGHGKRESAPATIPVCRVSPVPQTVLPCLCQKGQWQTRPFGGKCRRRNTRDRKPCPHDNDGHGISVTAAESRASPFSQLRHPFHFFRGALRHPTHFLLFLFTSPSVCQCPHAAIPDGISGHFRCRGKGNSGIVCGCKVRPPCGCPEKSPPSQAQVVFYPANLASPNPYL